MFIMAHEERARREMNKRKQTKRILVIDEVVNEIGRIAGSGKYPICAYFQAYMNYRKQLVQMEDVDSVKYYDNYIAEATKELNYTEIDFEK